MKHLALHMILKDWTEYWKTILILTGVMFAAPIFAIGGSQDFSRGVMLGIAISAVYGYSFYCFTAERRGTLQLLISLPITPYALLLAKFYSLYSMVLFTLNVPGVFLLDLRTLFLLNALVIFLSTMCMAVSVLSRQPWASLVPIWVALLFFMPVQRLVATYYPKGLAVYALIVSRAVWFAAAGIVISVFIAMLVATAFHLILTDED